MKGQKAMATVWWANVSCSTSFSTTTCLNNRIISELLLHSKYRALLLSGCATGFIAFCSANAYAQSVPVIVPAATPIADATPESDAVHIRRIKKFYKELLLKEKNVAAAVSVVNKTDIDAVGTTGSLQSVLRQTPSVNTYQSGIGQNEPVITVRGVPNTQLAYSLDGIPLQSLLSGGLGNFLTDSIDSPVTTGQTAGSTIYPGVAPPDRQGFATVGGTISFTTIKPTDKPYSELFGGYGSFNTSHAGFQLNSGTIAQLGNLKVLLRYDTGYTDGYLSDNTTKSQFGNMLFSAIKPYDDGLSHASLVVIYNRGRGYITTTPEPVPLIEQYGNKFNFPFSTTYTRQHNKYLTVIISNENYINPHLILSEKLFYTRKSEVFTSEQNPSTILYNPGFPYQIDFQAPYFAYGNIGNGPENYYYAPGYFDYNPLIFGSYAAGESAEQSYSLSNTIGFAPKANIFLGHNDITIGALIAKANSSGTEFVYGSEPMPEIIGYNSFGFGGGDQRTIYSVYAQDKINLFDDHLHIEPGVVLTGVYSSLVSGWSFGGYGAVTPSYKLSNYGKSATPYLGVSYDFPHNIVTYASFGKGVRYAPIGDYTLGSNGSTTKAPNPEVVRAYEIGIRYDTPRLYLNLDAFYQHLTSAFSFFTNYQTNLSQYINIGNQKFYGIEASGKVRLTHRLELFGNASYNAADYQNNYFGLDTPYQGHYGIILRGDPLTSVPQWTGNFGVEYTRGPLYVRFAGHYTGQQFNLGELPFVLPSSPEIAPPYPNSQIAGYSTPETFFKLPAYLLLNILATYKVPLHFQHVQYIKLSLNVQNLLGLDYYQHLFYGAAEIPTGGGNYLNTPQYVSAYTGPPRSVEVGATIRF